MEIVWTEASSGVPGGVGKVLRLNAEHRLKGQSHFTWMLKKNDDPRKLEVLKTQRLHQYRLNFSHHSLDASILEGFILYFSPFHFILTVTSSSSSSSSSSSGKWPNLTFFSCLFAYLTNQGHTRCQES